MLHRSFSINFVSIGVRDIGRSSFVGLVTVFTLDIGATSALFQIAGVKRFLMELLIIAHIGFAMVLDGSFKIQFGVESGPMVLDILMLVSRSSTSFRVMMNLLGLVSDP